MIKEIVIKAFNWFGITCFLRKINRTPLVLFWHGVSENPDPKIEAECISSAEFEAQMRYLKKHYEVISMDEFYKRYNNHSFNNREVVITFDDGYKNNLTVVAPILKKYGFPFTVFVSSANISSGKRFYASIPRIVILGNNIMSLEIPEFGVNYNVTNTKDLENEVFKIEESMKTLTLTDALRLSELIISKSESQFSDICATYAGLTPLSWDDVRELISNYDCTIGSHCDDHICCHSKQSIEEVEHQLATSKRIIERELGVECLYFSYPNGNFTTRSNKLVRKYYRMGFSTISRPLYASDENLANVARVSAAKNAEKFKILIAYKTNRRVKRILHTPKLIIKKVKYYFKWFLFRISQLGCLNPISPKIRPWLWKIIGVNIKGNVSIGYDVYFDVGNANLITIEDGVWITSRSLLLCHKRDMADYNKGDDYNNLPYIKAPIHLKKGCCIGMASLVMPGVTVGEGSVVGAGSLVIKDVPDWSIVTGHPAKVVKEL